MPTPRMKLRMIKEALRLKYDARLSHERIARALHISKGVVAKYVLTAACMKHFMPAVRSHPASVPSAASIPSIRPKQNGPTPKGVSPF